MKAMLYNEVGGPEVFQYTDVADPEPGAGDVIVDVAATSLNRLDLVQRNGWFQMPGFTLPHIAGMDVAGTVSAVGAGVTAVAIAMHYAQKTEHTAIKVQTPGGNLQVSFEHSAQGYKKIFLTGGAVHVFDGSIVIND